MTYRPPKEPRKPWVSKQEQLGAMRAKRIKRAAVREQRYARADQTISARDAANVGLPDRHSLPAEVVKVQ